MGTYLESSLVSVAWLAENLNQKGLRILDCTPSDPFVEEDIKTDQLGLDQRQKRHIPNGIKVDFLGGLSYPPIAPHLMMPDAEIFAEMMRKKGVGDGNTVICYDHSNNAWATRIWWMLKACGFDQVAVLNGGLIKWLAEGYETTTEQHTFPEAEKFSVVRRPQMMADKAAVLRSLENKDADLLHSMPRPMFTGEVESFGRRGRIPGSKHQYVEDILHQDDMTFLDSMVLRQKYQLAGLSPRKPVITYCANGVAASSNAFALTLLGYQYVSIYDGFVSEWCADTALPMEASALYS